MTSSPMLASPEELRVLLRVGEANSLDTDAYTQMILNQASNAVRDNAGRQDWVTVPIGDAPAEGEAHRPGTASDVTLWVALRAWTNPRNLERRTAGPISETFRDTGIVGLGLTDDEKDRLGAIPGATSSSLPWALSLSRPGSAPSPISVPTFNAGPGAMGFLIAMDNQFPYNTRPVIGP